MCLFFSSGQFKMVEELPFSKLEKVAGGCRTHIIVKPVFQCCALCRLLMAPHGTISSSKSEEDPGDREGWGKGCGLRETAVLLCPNGHLLSFLVPFPTLVR